MENIGDIIIYGNIVIGLVVFVFSILQIILFFKLWEMTNNVKRINNKIERTCDTDLLWEIRKSILKGDIRRAENLLSDEFVNDLRQLLRDNNHLTETSIAELKTDYAKYYAQLGVSLPDSIKRIKSKEDFYKVFTFSID